MAYDPDETEAVDRVRGRAGDTSDPPLLTGGEARYEAIVARHPDLGTVVTITGITMDAGEAFATAEALDALGAQLQLAAKSLSSSGESISYGERGADLLATAARYRSAATAALYPTAGPRFDLVGTGAVRTEARW